MKLLEILGTPNIIIIGFPLFVFIAVAVTENLKWKSSFNKKSSFWARFALIEWKYPIGFGVASLVVLLLMSLTN